MKKNILYSILLMLSFVIFPTQINATTYGAYTFDVDGDADESAWTFVSDGGANGLSPAGTARSWSHETDDTASTDVGPTSGQGGSPDGYVYTEGSDPGALNDTYTMTFNTTLDASSDSWYISFYTNQRGTTNDSTVVVQTNENSAGWVSRGSTFGGSSDPYKVALGGSQIWSYRYVDLTGLVSHASTQVRLLVTFPSAGDAWNNDYGIDTITISNTFPTTPIGGTYTESGGYGIHTFTSSGTFDPRGNTKSTEVLMVAGGGSGGDGSLDRGHGGGGAGGLINLTNYSISTSKVILIGAGSTSTGGSSGGNTTFDGNTAIGGGAGGSGSGGSGGGGNWGNGGGSGTGGQGYAGGTGWDSGTWDFCGGGGGGAGEVGESSTNSAADGGDGLQFDISGTLTYYAGGGGGGGTGGKNGEGGLGGGGGASGEDATGYGSGGKGGTGYGNNGNGSNGIVVIRYLLPSPPTTPTIGTAAVISDSSIQWNFTDNADDETGFKVYDTSNTLKATCASANLSSCTETGLTGNTSYTRKVVAYNGDGNSGYSSTDTATTDASSCVPTLGDSTHTITTDCTFTGYEDAANGAQIVSGLDSGTGTTNTSVLTVTSGTVTINSNETMVFGSIDLDGGSIAIATGGKFIPGGNLWAIDSDADGYPETTTFYAQTTAPTDGVRINTITDVTVADCDESDPGLNTSCCTAIDLYTDADGDGYGTGAVALNACPQSGYSSNNTDCNDTGASSNNVFVAVSCYVDADDDGHGSTTTKSCTDNAACLSATWGSDGNGTAATAGNFTDINNTDCNDGNASKYTNNWECDSCPNYCCTLGVVWDGGTCGSCAAGPIPPCSGPYTVTDGCTCNYVNESHICSYSDCNCGWVCGT